MSEFRPRVSSFDYRKPEVESLRRTRHLHVEYAERRIKHGILFMFSLCYEYSPHAYVRVPDIYRVYQAEYVICILVAVSQEYVITYSTPRTGHL